MYNKIFSETENVLMTWKVVHKSVGHLIQIKLISEETYIKGDAKSIKEARHRANKKIEMWRTK